MKIALAALLLLPLAACEKQPTPEEIAAQSTPAPTSAHTPAATPAPGDWRLKGYKNPLDQRPGTPSENKPRP